MGKTIIAILLLMFASCSPLTIKKDWRTLKTECISRYLDMGVHPNESVELCKYIMEFKNG